MSELLKAARAALEALDSHPDNSRRSFRAAADGLRAALAQPEQQAELPHLPTQYTTVTGPDGIGVKVWRAFQMRDYARSAMAAQPEQQAWTDEQIEARVKHLGARWNGDHWIIEDADLHPLGRALAQPEQQPEQQSPTIAVPRGLLQRVMKIAWGDAEGLSVGQCQDLASVESLPSYKEQTK